MHDTLAILHVQFLTGIAREALVQSFRNKYFIACECVTFATYSI